jgi:hypothetical protein
MLDLADGLSAAWPPTAAGLAAWCREDVGGAIRLADGPGLASRERREAAIFMWFVS